MFDVVFGWGGIYVFCVKLGVFLKEELFWLGFFVVGVIVDCFMILLKEVVGFVVVFVFKGGLCKGGVEDIDKLFFFLILVVVVGGVIIIVGVGFVEIFVCFVWGVLLIFIFDGVLVLDLVFIFGFIFILVCCLIK